MVSFKVITLFPEFFESPLSSGLLGRAVTSGKIGVETVDLKDFAGNSRHQCDDYTYGGGSGMVLRPEPLFKAIRASAGEKTSVILTSASGRLLDQALVKELYGIGDLLIICGRYEGIDQRVSDALVDYEISLGDFVISGGEYAALCIIDAVSRFEPGFMSNADSLLEESFEGHLLEYPHYTRPEVFEGRRVPEELLSGDHGRIARWREAQRLNKTRTVRPDLYRKYLLSKVKGEEQ